MNELAVITRTYFINGVSLIPLLSYPNFSLYLRFKSINEIFTIVLEMSKPVTNNYVPDNPYSVAMSVVEVVMFSTRNFIARGIPQSNVVTT